MINLTYHTVTKSLFFFDAIHGTCSAGLTDLTKGKIMKTLILITSLILSFTAIAETTVQTSAPTLKSTMSDMATTLKSISSQSQDSSKNESSIQLTEQFIKSVEKARELLPATANDKASQEQYVAMIDQVLVHAKELKAAFEKNENAKAIAILNSLVQAKKEGHSQFRN